MRPLPLVLLVSALAAAILWPLACSFPEINISGCLRGCGIEAGPCADQIDACLDACDDDVECSKDCTHLIEGCVEGAGDELVECAAACIEEAERKL